MFVRNGMLKVQTTFSACNIFAIKKCYKEKFPRDGSACWNL